MRLSEIYTSIQGEGPNVGKPTVFVRFGGCNLRCPGWGEGVLPDGTTVRGCDTIFAVYPQFRMEWEKVTPEQVLERISQYPEHVCITGGEPLLQPDKEMTEVVIGLLDNNHTIDLFTNGSMILPSWGRYDRVTAVMDYKMPSSGEYGSFNEDNWLRLQEKDAVKMVINPDREDDIQALQDVLKKHRLFDGRFYVGPVWGTDASKVAEIAEGENIELNIQTHKYIFGDIRGV